MRPRPIGLVFLLIVLAVVAAQDESPSCPPGQFLQEGTCTSCPVGSISAGGKATSCQQCGPGFTTTSTGASKCNACLPGFGSIKCNPCPTGKFSRGNSTRTCSFCNCKPAVCRVVTCDPTRGCVSSLAPAGTGCLFRSTLAGVCSATGSCVQLNTEARGPDGACKTTALLPAAINTKSKTEVMTAFLTLLYPHLRCYVFGFTSKWCCTKPGFPGSTGSCTPYSPGPGWTAETGKVINFFRLMAGVPPVVLNNTDWTKLSLSGALMCAAQQDISHQVTASSGWKCYSDDASKAVASSNLAFGSVGAQSMIGYVLDPGTNNVAVGHRRWLLRPNSQVLASGDAWHDKTGQVNPDKPGGYVYGPANDLYVMDLANYWSTPPKTAPVMQQKPFPFFSWPPAGAFVPYHLVFPRWHLSMEGLGYDRTVPNFGAANIFGNAQVTVTARTGGGAPTPVPTNVVLRDRQFLVFEPQISRVANSYYGWLMAKPTADITFNVTISGIAITGASQLSYEVTAFDIPGTDVLVDAPFAAGEEDPAAASSAVADDAAAVAAAAAEAGQLQPQGYVLLNSAPEATLKYDGGDN